MTLEGLDHRNSSFFSLKIGLLARAFFGASKTDNQSDGKEWHSHSDSRFLSRTGIRPIDLTASLPF